MIVDTDDALLVTTSEHAQRVKGVVDALKLTGHGNVSDDGSARIERAERSHLRLCNLWPTSRC